MKSGDFVLDCSIAMCWCFEDESNPYAETILDSLATRLAIVPLIWRIEAANVLLMAERRKRVSAQKSADMLVFLSELPILDDKLPVSHHLPAIVEVGRKHGLTAYDAAYLELAMRLSLPLATLDRSLIRAAGEAGVALVEI